MAAFSSSFIQYIFCWRDNLGGGISHTDRIGQTGCWRYETVSFCNYNTCSLSSIIHNCEPWFPDLIAQNMVHPLFFFFPPQHWEPKISRANITKVRKLSNTRMNVNRIQRQWKVQSGLIKSLSMWIEFPQASLHPVSDRESHPSLSPSEQIPIRWWVSVGVPVNHSLYFKDADGGDVLMDVLSGPSYLEQ